MPVGLDRRSALKTHLFSLNIQQTLHTRGAWLQCLQAREGEVEAAMFDGFAKVWTPVVLARRLKQAPLKVELAG